MEEANVSIKAFLVGMRYYGVSVADARAVLNSGGTLRRELNNSHDDNAIAVYSGRKKLGHIDRKSASMIAPLIDEGARHEVAFDPSTKRSKGSVAIIVKLHQTFQRIPVPKVVTGTVAGIYRIFRTGCDRCYIGQSLNVQVRVSQHWDDLMQGVHPNPELRELWRTHRAKQFNAELLEPAPRGLSELEMARWLVERERQWITRHGGLHKNINHVYPKIVLNVEARAQLEAERRLHSEEYKKLEQSVYLLDERADGFQDKIVYLEKMIESASKFWGFFTSTEEKRKADLARVKIENIRNAIWETRERRDAIHRQFVKLKEKLYPA